MKKALKISLYILAALLLLLLGLLIAAQSPKVQTALAHKAINMLRESIDGELSVGRVTIKPLDAVYIEDLLIVDDNPYSEEGRPRIDTLLKAGSIAARFSLGGLMDSRGVHVSSAHFKDVSFNLAIEPDEDHNTTNVQRIFRLKKGADEDEGDKPWGKIIDADKVDIEGFRFHMVNFSALRRHEAEGRQPLPPHVISWDDFTLSSDIHARNLSVADEYISGTVEHMTLGERRGADFHELSGKVKVGKGLASIRNLHIKDAVSDVYLKYFRMIGKLDDYSYFEDKIRIEAEILRPSVLSMQTISYFARGLDKFSFRAALKGKYEGYVNDFQVKDIVFQETTSKVSGIINGGMIGLPDVEHCLMDFKVKDFNFTMAGLESFVKSWAPRVKMGLSGMARGENFVFNGGARGPLNRMDINGKLNSRIGAAEAKLDLRNVIDDKRPIIIGGSLASKDLDVGRIAGIEQIREVTMVSGLEATFADDGMHVRLDSLQVDRLHAMDYDYSGISAAGTYSDKAFDGRFVSNDPNLTFLFQGTFSLSPMTSDADYDFYALLAYADLHALHLDKREVSKISFETVASFNRYSEEENEGDISIRGLSLESASGKHDFGTINVKTKTQADKHSIRLKAPFADGSYSGKESIIRMVSDLKDLAIRKELEALVDKGDSHWEGSDYHLSFNFLDTRALLDFFAPGVYIEKNSKVRLDVGEDGLMEGKISSGRLAYDGKYLKDLSLKFDNKDEALRADVSSSVLHLGGLELKGNSISIFADDNEIGAGYSFDNETAAANRGELYLNGALARKNGKIELKLKALPSNLYYEGEGWGLRCEEALIYDGAVKVKELLAECDNQRLSIEGGYSPRETDTLTVKMERFDLSLLDNLIGGKPEIKGRATGEALVLSPSSPMPGLVSMIQCDSTHIAGRPAGTIQLESRYNKSGKRFDFVLGNNLGGKKTLGIDGFFSPDGKKIGATAVLDGLDLAYISPFLEGIFDQFEGLVDGTVRVGGSLDRIQLSSEGARLRDGLMRVEFTQVPYHANGPVTVNNNGLFFNDVALTDGNGGKGVLSGGLPCRNLKNFALDTHINFEEMKVLAIKPDKSKVVYGDLSGTGRVDVTGPFDRILLEVDASTVKEGNLHIPLGSASSASIRNILTFKEKEEEVILDPYDLLTSESPKEVHHSGNFTIKLNVRATPDVTAYIDIGEGNSLSGIGSGTIELESKRSESMTMGGDYTLSKGNFHFSALDIVSRDFAIQEGSTVRFNGDVMSTDLDVNGVYTTKTSLSNLLSDSTSVARRTVNCGIHITDKLRNPQIGFSIDVPDLDPATQSQVESALNTEDKIQKQFLYLLITNSFLPMEESGITSGGSSMLYSNVTSIMAGQLNNIFQKLDIPLDLGLNYQPGDTGGDMFDVALSTQLFNNRVIVNGTIGSRRYSSNSNSEVSGDVDIEVKLDKPGTFRLNLFSHSADQYTAFLDNSQRNGIGLAYQREFSKPTSGMVTLQIDSTGKAVPKKEEDE